MSPPDDRPEIAPSEPEFGNDAWLDDLHGNPAYLKILDEIELNDDRPGIRADEVRAWIESQGTENELPKPRAK